MLGSDWVGDRFIENTIILKHPETVPGFPNTIILNVDPPFPKKILKTNLNGKLKKLDELKQTWYYVIIPTSVSEMEAFMNGTLLTC